MAVNPRKDRTTSNSRQDADRSSVKPVLKPVMNDSGSSASRTTGGYDTKETPTEPVRDTGVYERPVRKAGSMFVKVAIALMLVVIVGIILQLIF